MVRTQIQLGEEEYRHLRDVARRQGRSMADCIREGIRVFLQAAQAGDRDVTDIPAFHARSLDDLKAHDAWWAEAIAGGSPTEP